jgi:hypothetical protein
VRTISLQGNVSGPPILNEPAENHGTLRGFERDSYVLDEGANDRRPVIPRLKCAGHHEHHARYVLNGGRGWLPEVEAHRPVAPGSVGADCRGCRAILVGRTACQGSQQIDPLAGGGP